MQQAQDKEEILLKRPWTDEEEQKQPLLKDFDTFSCNKFF